MIKVKYSKDRPWYINLIYLILLLIFILVLPLNQVISIILKDFGLPNTINTIISNIAFIVILYMFYFKDLNKEFKTYKNNLKKNIKTGIKYYFVGLLAMVFFNMALSMILKDISANENQVRDMLFSMPFLTMFSISIVAPLSEEIIFRKGLMPLLKNKWIYALISGLLFGGAHLLSDTNFVPLDLLYILPYSSLGFVFALMNYETKTTYTSITMHAIHNTCTGLLLLLVSMTGVI